MNIRDDDPTFRSSGKFWAKIINATNAPLKVGATALLNPGDPPWRVGEHWSWSSGVLHSIADGERACASFVSVVNRGPKAVLEGHTYRFEAGVTDKLKFVFQIKGVSGGSVVVPGFGLQNLIDSKEWWTYFFPERFSGRWGLDVTHPGYAGRYHLVAEYNGQKSKDRGIDWSALSFEVKGWVSGRFAEGLDFRGRMDHEVPPPPEEGTALPMEDAPSSVETAGGVVITHEPL